MRIRNTTYASTPINTRLGVFTPDAQGILDVPEDAAKLLCSLANFVSLERTPRVLAFVEPSPPPVEPVGTADTLPPSHEPPEPLPPVLDVPAAPEVESSPADDVAVVSSRARKGPRPKSS